jgi:hypothetical protein
LGDDDDDDDRDFVSLEMLDWPFSA